MKFFSTFYLMLLYVLYDLISCNKEAQVLLSNKEIREILKCFGDLNLEEGCVICRYITQKIYKVLDISSMCPDIIETKLMYEREREWKPNPQMINKWLVLYNLQNDYLKRIRPNLDAMKNNVDIMNKKIEKEKEQKENLRNSQQFINKMNSDVNKNNEKVNNSFDSNDKKCDDEELMYKNNKIVGPAKEDFDNYDTTQKGINPEVSSPKNNKNPHVANNLEMINLIDKGLNRKSNSNNQFNSDMPNVFAFNKKLLNQLKTEGRKDTEIGNAYRASDPLKPNIPISNENVNLNRNNGEIKLDNSNINKLKAEMNSFKFSEKTSSISQEEEQTSSDFPNPQDNDNSIGSPEIIDLDLTKDGGKSSIDFKKIIENIQLNNGEEIQYLGTSVGTPYEDESKGLKHKKINSLKFNKSTEINDRKKSAENNNTKKRNSAFMNKLRVINKFNNKIGNSFQNKASAKTTNFKGIINMGKIITNGKGTAERFFENKDIISASDPAYENLINRNKQNLFNQSKEKLKQQVKNIDKNLKVKSIFDPDHNPIKMGLKIKNNNNQKFNEANNTQFYKNSNFTEINNNLDSHDINFAEIAEQNIEDENKNDTRIKNDDMNLYLLEKKSQEVKNKNPGVNRDNNSFNNLNLQNSIINNNNNVHAENDVQRLMQIKMNNNHQGNNLYNPQIGFGGSNNDPQKFNSQIQNINNKIISQFANYSFPSQINTASNNQVNRQSMNAFGVANSGIFQENLNESPATTTDPVSSTFNPNANKLKLSNDPQSLKINKNSATKKSESNFHKLEDDFSNLSLPPDNPLNKEILHRLNKIKKLKFLNDAKFGEKEDDSIINSYDNESGTHDGMEKRIANPPPSFLEMEDSVYFDKSLFDTLIKKSENYNLETQRRGRRRSRFPDPQWDCAETQIAKLVRYLCEEEVSSSYQKYCKPIFEQINTMIESFLYHDNNLEICQNLHMCPVSVDI